MATYYVDFDTGANTNTGLIGFPWKYCPGTVGETGDGWEEIGTGDTVIFTAGQTWDKQITIEATGEGGNFAEPTQESERITLTSSSTTLAIFDLSGVNSGFLVDGIDYLSIEYFEIKDLTNAGAAAGIRVGNSPVEDKTTYLKILYCSIHDIIDSNVREGYGINHDEAAYCEIAYSSVYNCEKKLISYNEIEAQRLGCDHNTVHHCLLYQESGFAGSGLDHGIACAGTYNEFYNNILWTDQTPGSAPSYAIKLDGLADGTSNSYNKVYNNLVLKWICGICSFDSLNGNEIIGNTIYLQNMYSGSPSSADHNGIAIRGDSGTYSSGNVVRNNIVYYPNSYAVMYLGTASATVANNTVTNNLLYKTGGDEGIRVGSTERTLAWVETATNWDGVNGNVAENNTIDAPGFLGGTHTVSSLPTGFTAGWLPNANGLSITDNSAAKDIGYPAGSPFNVDILGVSRPQGAVWDVGAYEYQDVIVFNKSTVLRFG